MLSKFPIVLVTDPRQAGKTTLLREKFKDYEYVNLEFFKGIHFLRKAAPQTKGRNIVLYAGDAPQKRSEAEVLPWSALCEL
jgi:predicted AAA+ superfamily ATPase